MSMDKTLFNELRQSLEQARTITQGEMKASRRFVVPTPDVRRSGRGAHRPFPKRLCTADVRPCQNAAKLGAESPLSDRPRFRFAQDRVFRSRSRLEVSAPLNQHLVCFNYA